MKEKENLIEENILTTNENNSQSVIYYRKYLAFIVFGGIFLYFFILKFDSIQHIFSKIVTILFPFLLGAAIAFIMKIPMNALEQKLLKKSKIKFIQNNSRGLSLLLSIIFVISVIIFMFSMVIPQLIKSIQSLEKQLPIFFEYIINWLRKIPKLASYASKVESFYKSLSFENIFEQLKSFILTKDWTDLNGNALQTASGIANAIFSTIANSFLAFVFSIYVLLDKDRLGRQTKRLLYSVGGLKIGGFLIHIGELFNYYFLNFVKGQLLDALIIGIMTFISMTILQMPYSAMIAVLVGFSDLIPIVGPLIGTAIGFIFILIDSPIQALIFLILLVVLQQIQGNIIYPKIVGDNLGIPSMWSLFATIVGGALGGIVGMWTFIPLIAVIYTLLGEYTSYRLKKFNITNLD